MTQFDGTGALATQYGQYPEINEVLAMSEENKQPELEVKYYPKKMLYTTEDVRIIIGAANKSTVRMAKKNNRITPADMPGRDLWFAPDEVIRFARDEYNIDLILNGSN